MRNGRNRKLGILAIVLAMAVMLSGCSSSKNSGDVASKNEVVKQAKELSGKVDIFMESAAEGESVALIDSGSSTAIHYKMAFLNIKKGSEVCFSEDMKYISVSKRKTADLIDESGKRVKGEVNNVYITGNDGTYWLYIAGSIDVKKTGEVAVKAGETIFTITSDNVYFFTDDLKGFDVQIKPKTNVVVKYRYFLN